MGRDPETSAGLLGLSKRRTLSQLSTARGERGGGGRRGTYRVPERLGRSVLRAPRCRRVGTWGEGEHESQRQPRWWSGRQEAVPHRAGPAALISSSVLPSCFLPLGLHKLSEESTLSGTGAGQERSEVTVEGAGTETHQAWDLLPNPGGHCSKTSFW